MTIHGIAGVGKTRLVAHALDTDELGDGVLYVNGPEHLQILLSRLVRNAESLGVLFADEIDEHTVAEALKRLTGIRGRWRLVSVTTQSEHRWVAGGPRTLFLDPLTDDATRRLVVEFSKLPERTAEMVAQVAAGFPELAFRLAQELQA